MSVKIEDLPSHVQEKVRARNEKEHPKPKETFKEKVRKRYSQVKSVVNRVVPHKDSTQKKSSNEKTKKGRPRKPYRGLENLPSKRSGARYTSVFGARLDEGAVPGEFVDPFAVEHEVRGSGNSPFRLSMGRPPAPYIPSPPSPGQMMGRPKRRR